MTDTLQPLRIEPETGTGADLRSFLTRHGLPALVPLRRKVLVPVDGHAYTEYLIRLGRRFAERLHAPWTVAWVDTGRARTDRRSLQAAFQLAQRLA